MERDLNAIKCTIAAIESADSNIARLDKFRQHEELLIIPNGSKIKKLIKEMGYSDEENPNPIYQSGKPKDIILDALKAYHLAFKEKMKLKLEKELTQVG